MYNQRICHSSPCPSVALPGRDFWAGVMGREAASSLLNITVLEATFSARALPGDSSTPELHSTALASQGAATFRAECSRGLQCSNHAQIRMTDVIPRAYIC